MYLPGAGSSADSSSWREQRGNDDWRNNTWREQRLDQNWRNSDDWRQRRTDEDWQRREDDAKQRTPNNATDRGFDGESGTGGKSKKTDEGCGADASGSEPCLNNSSGTKK